MKNDNVKLKIYKFIPQLRDTKTLHFEIYIFN
jgi:hypothetical protein